MSERVEMIVRLGKILFWAIAVWALIAFLLFLFFTGIEEGKIKQPIESTRQVILTCTVKSNIDGVITLNDECDLIVIGEE